MAPTDAPEISRPALQWMLAEVDRAPDVHQHGTALIAPPQAENQRVDVGMRYIAEGDVTIYSLAVVGALLGIVGIGMGCCRPEPWSPSRLCTLPL